ncbi:MAG: methionyl-tRNA formyltransferase [Gaiellales bacterium]
MARIAVAATAPFGADVLDRLAARHDVSMLLTRPDSRQGRGRRVAAPPAKLVAEQRGIQVCQPERPEPGLELEAPIVIVCAYGLLVPDALLAERLWLNVHPSLLPRWRGAAPVERAILAGDPETGVTIHETVKELDAGPIAAQHAFTIGDADAGEVFTRAAEVAVELLDDVLGAAERDALTLVPQGAVGVTYAEKLGPDDRVLDLEAPAAECVRRVRALAPHVGARAVLQGRPVVVWRAEVAADGSFAPLEVQPEGGRRMAYDAWLRGLR